MNKITDLRVAENEPHSIEAEQLVLGAILLGQPTGEVQALGGADIFHDPVHAAIYQLCRQLEKADKLVSPVTIAASLTPDLVTGLSEIGGKGYLVRLAGAAISPRYIGDYASVMAEARAKRNLLELMRVAQSELANGDRSASDVAAKMEVGFQVFEQSETRVKPVSMTVATAAAMKNLYAAWQGEEIPVVKPGIAALERLTPGFARGELWLLGGRPSMGKSACALCMGLNAARAGHSVVIASLEMTPEAMAYRALSEGTSREKLATKYTSMRTGDFSEKQGEVIKVAALKLSELPITFLPPEYQDAELLQVGVKQSLRRMNCEKPPLVIVDYAQLMRSKARTRYEQITDISMALKGMAMRLNVPVLALSQLSRALESRPDKRPMLSDLRESGQLEQDADGVMFCFREEYYLEREEPEHFTTEHSDWLDAMREQKHRLEIIVAKQRQGMIGTAKVRFNPALNVIWED